MDQWIDMGRRLRELINPSTMPVAVKITDGLVKSRKLRN